MSFIYNKTSPGKGGMIGTVYHNYHHSVLTVYLYLSRSSPKDPVTLKLGVRMSCMDLCVPSQV